MEKMHYVELYQHPAASLFQCIFAWLLITVQHRKKEFIITDKEVLR